MRCLKSNEDMILALAGQFLSKCLMNLKNSGDSTGFEPMTSAMPVQCSNQLSYEITQLRAGQFVGLMFPMKFFRFMRHLLKNCPASARIISSFDLYYKLQSELLMYYTCMCLIKVLVIVFLIHHSCVFKRCNNSIIL